MIISCIIFVFIKNNIVLSTTTNSEITGTMPEKNTSIDDRIFLVYGYQIKDNLVELNYANTVYNISIMTDKENFIYFCLNERKYNPSDGELNTLQKNKQLSPEINWLSSNFYNNIESLILTENTPNKSGGNSPISSFNSANFYNKYVYTQLAIWHFTNPENFPITNDVIKNNPEVKALINEANKNSDFYNPTYNQAIDSIEDIHYEATELVKDSEDDDTYIFSTTIIKSGSNELFDTKEINYTIYLEENNQAHDITKSVTIIPKEKNKIYISVPKKILNESQAKLTVSATVNVTSDKAFTTYYDNENNKQPVMSAYKLSKPLSTEKSIDINYQTHYTVYKRWADNNNQDGKRPISINVQLYANNQALGNSVTLHSENNWKYTWNELNTKINGEEIEYSVKEVEVPDLYIASITTDKDELSTTITNSYIPELTTISGKKIWNDGDNQDGIRPDAVTVNLLEDGNPIAQKTITPDQDGHWWYEFIDVPVYKNGEKIIYTVTENNIPGYSTELNGTTITNYYTPGKTSISLSKIWDDQNNQDNLRPNNIQIQLYAQTTQSITPVGSIVTLDENNHWFTTWMDLPLMAKGEQINYTVKEVNQSANIPGYTTNIDETNHGNIIITNKHDVEMTTIYGQKIWNDKDNQDGIRPNQLNIILYANGIEIDQKIITSNDNWSYEFTDLPVYSKGKKINYKIDEVTVPGYELELDGNILINTHIPETTTITGAKIWHDKNNQDGIRPSNLIVILYANGTEVARQIVTDETNWVYTFKDLPKNSNGKEIDYTIQEVAVPQYNLTANDINLLNVHKTARTEISGKKIWDDKNNQDGKRPKEIIVNLLANGNKIAEKMINESDNWNYTFTDLPKYSDGKPIIYAITENNVPNYSLEIDGTNLINHYTPGKTNVTVTKSWNDEHNQYGKRPNSIKIQLYSDKKILGYPVILNDENNWKYTWTGLDQKINGKEIKYTIKEVDLAPGYESTINDEDIGNIIITNSYTPTIIKPTSSNSNLKKITNIPYLGEVSTMLYILLGVILVIIGFSFYKLKKRSSL